MDLRNVIVGQVVTEKSERLKGELKTYTLLVPLSANKIELKNALEKFFDVEVESIRVHLVRPKTRLLGRGGQMEKRHRSKRMLVRLSKKSKPLDLASAKIS